MNNDKEVVRETISEKIVRAMDISKIKAIAFAEVGAQGRPDYNTQGLYRAAYPDEGI